MSTTVTPNRLIPNSPENIPTGRTYVDVGNAGFPGGEIRGQILP
ncbi:MAG TPA: CHRD domain-containing protein [Planctomycetota bacterium]|nr:CHRD domain-containing protein [Planctomycetota bacterium]